MLDRLNAARFLPSEGRVCALHLPDGSSLPIMIDSVSEKPQYRNPYAPEGQRLPFSIAFTAQKPTHFEDGICALELVDGEKIEGIFVSRVAPLGRDPALAYFQLIFN